ncbi:hypothetical protein [Oceanispirochaeta sp.]|jgi:hypothetical protein|uniref:hypothetical protein n=1 Tax=Oceanispirochaeta sp. TaxID=2035350 RepID=UPI002613123C|nr:hypothetical protein [Oceanispirochaeta sp.]MDA3956243.1 hypothetical protein [Oceanispirochaeta sp.]
MRLFIALYLGRPYTSEVDTALPQPAYNILKKEAGLNEEELKALEKELWFWIQFMLQKQKIPMIMMKRFFRECWISFNTNHARD